MDDLHLSVWRLVRTCIPSEYRSTSTYTNCPVRSNCPKVTSDTTYVDLGQLGIPLCISPWPPTAGAMAESTYFRSSQDLPAYLVEYRRRGSPLGLNGVQRFFVRFCTQIFTPFVSKSGNVCSWGSFKIAAAHYVQSRG